MVQIWYRYKLLKDKKTTIIDKNQESLLSHRRFLIKNAYSLASQKIDVKYYRNAHSLTNN